MAEVSWSAAGIEGEWSLRVRAADFLKGAVGTVGEPVDGEEGWVRPLRFTSEQLRALSSCAAWHPALFRVQAAATAGVCLEVRTAATRLAVEVSATAAPAVAAGDDGSNPAGDGYSVDVDGEHLPQVIAAQGTGAVRIALDGPAGEGAPRLVRLWLPYLTACRIKELVADAPVEAVDARRLLLVIGDSIAQGEEAGDPGLSWPARIARGAGVDVLNQGLLGQVFQPSEISSLAGAVRPDLIWVALGANYRHEECYPGTVERDVRSSLAFMRRQWRDCPMWVASPTPHDETITPSVFQSCWRQVPEIIERVCERWPQFTYVDGEELLDDDRALRADADHPNAEGHAQMARRIARVLAGEGPLTEEERAAREAPRYGRDAQRPRRSQRRDPGATSAGRPAPGAPEAEEAGEPPLDADAVSVPPSYEARARRQVRQVTEVVDVVEIRDDTVGDARRSSSRRPPISSAAATTVLDRRGMQAASELRDARRSAALEEDTEALLELLAEGPIDTVPLEQLLLRRIGTPTFVSEGFCSVDLPNGARCLWGEDVIEARRVLSRQRRPNLVICLSAGLEPMVRRIFPTEESTLWYTLAVYEGTDQLPLETDLLIEPLDNSWAGFINRSYSFPEGIDGAELAHMLSLGLVLGGYDPNGNLVGYIGEWREGAMGMLEVLPHARHRGYGSALESAKANEHLAKGWTPFAQVLDGNDASLRLQRALGLTLAEEKQCYIPLSG